MYSKYYPPWKMDLKRGQIQFNQIITQLLDRFEGGRSLLLTSELTELEVRAVLSEVISGNLEWAYHETDGQYKMAAYAFGAFDAAGLNWSLNEAEREELKSSILWSLLMINS
jgi:hypothetical protein